MGFLVSEVDTRLSSIMNDASRIRWPLTERLDWINDGAKEIVIRRPAAGAKTVISTLVAGTRQSITGIELLDVVRNIKADGTSPGRIIRLTERHLLDDQDPDWHTGREQTAAKHFTYDERTPTEYYVWPPVKVGTKVQLVQSQSPAAVDELTDTIDLDTAYLGPLVSYVLYRALAKDSEYGNGVVAAAHFSAFSEAVGTRNQIAVAASPNAEAA